MGRGPVKSQVFEEVQAALLNSEGEPEFEISLALEAVASFALAEGLTKEVFLFLAEAAFDTQEAL
jgi:hypothetical protein